MDQETTLTMDLKKEEDEVVDDEVEVGKEEGGGGGVSVIAVAATTIAAAAATTATYPGSASPPAKATTKPKAGWWNQKPGTKSSSATTPTTTTTAPSLLSPTLMMGGPAENEGSRNEPALERVGGKVEESPSAAAAWSASILVGNDAPEENGQKEVGVATPSETNDNRAMGATATASSSDSMEQPANRPRPRKRAAAKSVLSPQRKTRKSFRETASLESNGAPSAPATKPASIAKGKSASASKKATSTTSKGKSPTSKPAKESKVKKAVKGKKPTTQTKKKASSSKGAAAAAAIGPSPMIYEGEPTRALQGGWPPGWIERTYERQVGASAGGKDSYWYPPSTQNHQHKLRSIAEVKRYIAALAETEGDEAQAFAKRKG
jgi:hypothetical protein